MLALALFEEAKKKTELTISLKQDGIPFTDEIKSVLLSSDSNYKSIKVVNLAVDFYVCLFIQNACTKNISGITGFDPLTGKECFIFDDIKYINWSLNFNKTFTERLRFIDSFMYTYLCAAVSGELRHAPGKVGQKLSTYEKSQLDFYGITKDFQCDQTRAGTQKRFLGEMNSAKTIDFLKIAESVYNNYNWGGGFGGKKWGDIATCGLDRAIGKLDKISFIDRVFDLKHNGGPIFDKNKAVDNSYLQQFLDVKLHATKETDFEGYLNRCSPEVIACIKHTQELGMWKGASVAGMSGQTFIGKAEVIEKDSWASASPSFNKPKAPKIPSEYVNLVYKTEANPGPCPIQLHG